MKAIPNTEGWRSAKVDAYVWIANKYSEIGDSDKSTELLSKALFLSSTSIDWKGNRVIADLDYHLRHALYKIGLGYSVDGNMLSSADRELLSEIIIKAYPPGTIWN